MSNVESGVFSRVIYLHGFASSAQSTKAQFFAGKFAEVGIPLVAPDLNAPDFSTLTVTRMLDEVGHTIAESPPGPIVLMGSSLGAFVAWHAAARLPLLLPQHPITRMVLLAPAVTFGRNRQQDFGHGVVDEWERAGTREFFHYGENAPRQLHYEFYRDALTYPAAHAEVQVPTLIFQGMQDDVVQPQGVIEFCQGRPNVSLRLLRDGHQLLAHLDEMWRETRIFLGC
jgi:pimeloyl-ACP methyl ester carboxylesterase